MRFTGSTRPSRTPSCPTWRGLIIPGGGHHRKPLLRDHRAALIPGQIFIFEPLEPEDIGHHPGRALSESERGLGGLKSEVSREALDYLAAMAGGDARRALNALELAV